MTVRTRDGVTLRADVFRPSRPGRYPVVLVRTPYNKLGTTATQHLMFFDVLATVRAGFVVVLQDTRGRYASDGDFSYFPGEVSDGVDMISWAATQGWSSGSVGMVGASYAGATQLLPATRGPQALRTIIPALTASEYYEGWTYQGGAFQLGFALMWAVGLAYTDVLNRESRGEAVGPGREALEDVVSDLWGAYRRLPLVDVAESTPWLRHYHEWLSHPDRDAYWRGTAINERYSEINVPAIHIAGWNDIFLKGTLENYVGLRDGAGTQLARDHQRLIVTPYGHSQGHGESAGDLWYGAAAEYVFASRRASPSGAAPIDLPRECIEWLDACLKDGPDHEGPPVRLFVMGANRWRDEEDWPLTRAVTRRWYLRTDEGLSPESPGDEAPDEFVFDPLDPVPTAGGQTLLPGGGFFMGPRDRRAIERRPDVLVYTSEPLQRELEVTGYITVTLHVATSGVDTDFTAALVDVHPDGRALGVVDGILRLRYRDGTAHAVLAEPGQVYEIEIDLQATSNVFGVGHRIRVEISSSNFPRFDRNPNTAGAVAEADESRFQVARQVVFHDADRASFVTLPVIEGSR